MSNSLGLIAPMYAAPADWTQASVNLGGTVPAILRTGTYLADQTTLDSVVTASVAAGSPIVFLSIPPMGFTSDPRMSNPNAYYPTPALIAEQISNARSVSTSAAASASAAVTAVNSIENHAGPANLPHWKQRLNLSLLGQSPARLLCMGDSTTTGVSADSYTTAPGTTQQNTPNAYPYQLAKILTAQGIPADVAFSTPGSSGSVDPHWSFSAGASYSAPTVGIGGSQGVTLPSVNAQTICTPGFAADTYKIYYYQSSGSGTFTAQATGGSVNTVNCNATPAGVVTRTITAASASTSNTVTMICTVLGSGCVIMGIEYWNSANPNRVRILPCGASGQPTSSFADATAYGSAATALALAPDLTIISLGINDVKVATPTATTMTRLGTLATNAQLTGDALFMSAVPCGTGSAGPVDVTALNAAIGAVGGAYVDLQSRYGRNMFTQGLQTSDQVHPNAMGYGDIARVVAAALVR